MTRLLHVEELARLAGVHKSTVLLAARRDLIPSCRISGRTCFTPEDACEYLRRRGCPVPPSLEREPVPGPVVGVLTDSLATLDLVRAALPPNATLRGGENVFATLVELEASAPAVILVDLGLRALDACVLLRGIRTSRALARGRLLALGSAGEAHAVVREVGAELVAPAALSAVLHDGAPRPAAAPKPSRSKAGRVSAG